MLLDPVQAFIQVLVTLCSHCTVRLDFVEVVPEVALILDDPGDGLGEIGMVSLRSIETPQHGGKVFCHAVILGGVAKHRYGAAPFANVVRQFIQRSRFGLL